MKDFRCYFLQLLHAYNYNIIKIDSKVLHSSGMSFWSSSKRWKRENNQQLEKNYNVYEDLHIISDEFDTYPY